MALVTAPRNGIPIGTVTIGGQLLPVVIHPEYLRFFEGVLARSGGVTGANLPGESMEALVRANHAQPMQAGTQMPPDLGYIRAFSQHPMSAAPGLGFVELRAMLPHAPANQPTADDSQSVIASRIFGR